MNIESGRSRENVNSGSLEEHSHEGERVSNEAKKETLENCFDIFKNENWLVHNLPYESKNEVFDRVMKEGLFSESFSERARGMRRKELLNERREKENPIGRLLKKGKIRDEVEERVDTEYVKIKNMHQGKRNISAFLPNLDNVKVPTFRSMGVEVGVAFLPLKREIGDEGYGYQANISAERVAHIRVAPRRFKFLVTPDFGPVIDIPDTEFEAKGTSRGEYESKLSNIFPARGREDEILQNMISYAEKQKIPIFDRYKNMLWPLKLTSDQLRGITIEKLHEIIREKGLEEMQTMSPDDMLKYQKTAPTETG